MLDSTYESTLGYLSVLASTEISTKGWMVSEIRFFEVLKDRIRFTFLTLKMNRFNLFGVWSDLKVKRAFVFMTVFMNYTT